MSIQSQPRVSMTAGPIAAIALVFILAGCATDSFLDPSRTGRFENEPTMIPILDRIDVIEDRDSRWARTTEVTPEDLLPNDLTYRLTPGDFVTVEIFELFMTNQWTVRTTRVDAGGFIRLPVVGDVRAGGRTPQELEDQIKQVLRADLVLEPEVNVLIEEGSAFTWTVRGAVGQPAQYTLRDPDLRLNQALAQAGDVIGQPRRIFVIREVPLSEAMRPSFERDPSDPGDQQRQPGEQPVDVEDLIDQLSPPDRGDDDDGAGGGGGRGGGLVDVDSVNPADDLAAGETISPGAVQDPAAPPVDIDDLEPVRVQTPQDEQPVDIGRTDTPRSGDISYIYDEERGQWIPVRRPAGDEEGDVIDRSLPLAIERVIEIPYQELTEGQTKYNIIIRPNDYIYVERPRFGLVYVEGEVARPGTYEFPADGSDLTLSRVIAAAGGLGPLAVPTRVDLTRIVGENREATIRMDLAAIRQRTEPDVILRPMDHIIVGTDFWATPLAIIRNGFRVTYGFGFLLDRNFGNDVFGAPPTNRLGE